MPSIAQQDYLRPQGKSLSDCHLLAALAHNVQQGTIFDTIVSYINVDFEPDNAKVIAANYFQPPFAYLHIYDAANSTMETISITYTQTQYEGLAAIQDAEEDWSVIAKLADGYNGVDGLYDVKGGGWICVGGKKILPTVTNGKIVELSLSNETPPVEDSFYNLSWEDAQKLIGLPIS